MQEVVLQITNLITFLFNTKRRSSRLSSSTILVYSVFELLTNQIRNNEKNSGINICGFELKNACYADDASFILDGSKKSFEALVRILENFSNISGLN